MGMRREGKGREGKRRERGGKGEGRPPFRKLMDPPLAGVYEPVLQMPALPDFLRFITKSVFNDKYLYT